MKLVDALSLLGNLFFVVYFLCKRWLRWAYPKRCPECGANRPEPLSAESVRRIMGAVRDVERRDDPGSLKSVSAADVLADEVGRFECNIEFGTMPDENGNRARVWICGGGGNCSLAVPSAQQSAPGTTTSANPPLDERKG